MRFLCPSFAFLVIIYAILCANIAHTSAAQCEGHFYVISTSKRIWENANTACINNGGTLASIKDKETQNLLVAKAKARFASGNAYIYLGSRRGTNANTFQWLDGTVFATRTSSTGSWTNVGYTAWRSGNVGSGLCVQLVREDSHGRVWEWNAGGCDASNYYICQNQGPRVISFSQSSYSAIYRDPVTISGTISGLYTEPLTVTAIYNSNQRVTLQTNYKGSSFSYPISSVTASHVGAIQIEISGNNCTTSGSVNLGIEESLTHSVENNEIIVDYGKQKRVTCTATGYTNPAVRWKRSGSELAHSSSSSSPHIYQITSQPNTYTGRSVLHLTLRDAAESGEYVCEATNWNVAGSKTKLLQVKVSANITIQSTINVNSDQQRLVDCDSFGFPEPTVTWKKNTVPVSRNKVSTVYQATDTRSAFRNRVRLYITINDVLQSDVYECTANNGVGSSKKRSWSANVPAAVSVSQSYVTALYGLEVTVDCTSFGFSKPMVNWYRGDTAVSTSKNDLIHQTEISLESDYSRTNRLHLTVTDASQRGIYECRSNIGQPPKKAEINVNVVSNTNISTSVIIAEHLKRYKVDCVSYGSPIPNVQWKRKGTTIDKTFSAHIYTDVVNETTYFRTTRLYFAINDVADSGLYICVTEDEQVTDKEKTLNITIPANISLSSTSKVISLPETFVISCESYGYPLPNTSWTRNEIPVNKSGAVYQRRTISGNYKSVSSLHLNVTTMDQVGEYECQAENVDTTGVKALFQAAVQANVSLSNKSVTVLEDESYNITCTSFGFPTPNLYWSKNSINTTTDSNRRVYQNIVRVSNYQTTTELYLRKPTFQDSGEYVCSVNNSAGNVSPVQDSANITVGPYYISNMAPKEFSQTQTFVCTFGGSPSTVVNWKINGHFIENQNKTPTKVIQSSDRIQSNLTVSSSVIFGLNSSVECWANNYVGSSKQRTMKMNSDLLFSNGSYYTKPNSTDRFTHASDYCKSVGGYLPTVAILNITNLSFGSSNNQRLWVQGSNSDGSQNVCNTFQISHRNVTEEDCDAKSNHYICLFSSLEILNTSKCFFDRVTVKWKDMTGNNGHITHIVTALNDSQSVNVSKVATQTSTSNHVYTSTIENLVTDSSYRVSLRMFPDVWRLSIPTVTGMTSSVFRNVSGEISLSGAVCQIVVKLPTNILDMVKTVELHFAKVEIGSVAQPSDWTYKSFSPNSSIEHSETIGENQELVVKFQPITSICTNTIFDVSGECKVPPVVGPETPILPAVAGSLVAFLMLVLIVVLAIYFRDRIRTCIPSKNTTVAQRPEPTHTLDVPIQHTSREESTTILKFYLGEFFIDSAKNGHAILKQQFEKIKEESKNYASIYDATAQAKTSKNRYKNIIPYDHNTVILRGVEGSKNHYINASYVEGFKEPGKWIATQGPIAKTVNDFWTMIWEQNARIIVMLANLYEKGKSKCALYWPEEIGKTENYQRVSVSVIDIIHKGNYVIRKLAIEEINSTYVSDQHIVTQYHFIAWPDHGVPRTTTGLVKYIKEIQENQARLQEELQTDVPAVVHCSAGAGRTGTFIGFDYLMKELNDIGSVNVFKAVCRMREQRMEMVQTMEQYVFLHKLLAETVAFNETDLQVEQLCEKVGQHNRYQHANEIIKEFNDLSILFGESTVSPVTIKNSTSVYYSSSDGTQGSNENGIYKVESYNPSDHLMVGGEPDPAAVEDFLSVLLLENTGFVIQVVQPMENIVWPNQTNPVSQYGDISVQFIDETSSENVKVTRVSVANEEQQRKIQVFLFGFDCWTDKETPTDDNSMIQFLSVIESYHSVTSECSMLFLSRNGFSKSVMFCAAWNLISRYKAEFKVDVFRTVKDITDSLPNMPLSEDQYKACYSLISAYTNPSQY